MWERKEWGDAFRPMDAGGPVYADEEPVPIEKTIPLDTSGCSMCADSGLMLGGWMGPTKEAPYPRACTRCERGAELDTPRKVQLKVLEMVGRAWEDGSGWWTAKYPALATLHGHLEDVERAVELDTALPPVFDLLANGPIPNKTSYNDAAGRAVIEYRMDTYGSNIDSTFKGSLAEVAEAEVVKFVDERTGAKRVVKHRRHMTPYFECGHDREPFGKCTLPNSHTGVHEDEIRGRRWDG